MGARTGRTVNLGHGQSVRRWAALGALVVVAATGCTSEPDPSPAPTAVSSGDGTLAVPAVLGTVTVEGTVTLEGDGGRLSAVVTNQSGEALTVTGIACACASSIRMGTVTDGEFVPLDGGLDLAAGDTLHVGGPGEPQIELTGLLPSTVPDAVVPVVVHLAGRTPVQGVATVLDGAH